MEANVEGYKGPLTVRQFKGGQSNPTYQLITPTKKYVMRRKPPGKLLPSAHAVDREYPRDRGALSARLPGGASPTGSARTRASPARCSTSWTWSKAASCGTRPCPTTRPRTPRDLRRQGLDVRRAAQCRLDEGRASKASARKATTSPARSIAGRSNTRCPRRPRSRRWTG